MQPLYRPTTSARANGEAVTAYPSRERRLGALLVGSLLVGLTQGSCDQERPVDQPEPAVDLLYSAEDCSSELAGSLFERRIAPLLDDDRVSSCNECHLSGIDLGLFVRGDPCQTMACLAADGLVDLRDPDRSLILTWIDRASPSSPLITEDVIAQERAAFVEWTHFHAVCGEIVCSGVTCDARDAAAPFCEHTPVPALESIPFDAAPDGCSPLAIELLFQQSVYASRGRCYPCHYDSHQGTPLNAPRWIHTEGNCDSASLATLRAVQRGGYLDVDDPGQSLLLLKPLGEQGGGVEHGGDNKLHGEEDPAYVNFKRFLDRYAECFDD
jgi:hypothetical protein